MSDKGSEYVRVKQDDLQRLLDACFELVEVLADPDYKRDSFTAQPLAQALRPFMHSKHLNWCNNCGFRPSMAGSSLCHECSRLCAEWEQEVRATWA